MVNSWISHVKAYAAANGITYPQAMVKAKASYTKMTPTRPTARKLKGGKTLKQEGLDLYNKVPSQYKPGIESLGKAAFKQMGFGFFDNIKNAIENPIQNIAIKPVQKIINNPVRAIQDIYMNPLGPVAKIAIDKLMPEVSKNMSKQEKAMLKAIAKQVAKKILTHGLAAAPAAAAAAATASGNPQLAIPAAILAREIVSRSNAQEKGEKYIDGMGMNLRMRKTTRGRALRPAGGALMPAGGALMPAGPTYSYR